MRHGAAEIPSFRRKYRGVDLLLIDDIQFLAGKKGTLVELLHPMEFALREGRQSVFAADRAPAELSDWEWISLRGWPAGWFASWISPIRKRESHWLASFNETGSGIEITEEVADFIATKMSTGAREIFGT